MITLCDPYVEILMAGHTVVIFRGILIAWKIPFGHNSLILLRNSLIDIQLMRGRSALRRRVTLSLNDRVESTKFMRRWIENIFTIHLSCCSRIRQYYINNYNLNLKQTIYIDLMLELQPVTKFKKEAFSRWLKDKDKSKHLHANSTYFQQEYTPEDILEDASLPRNQVYEDRQFEDSHLTKFIHEQLLITKFFMNHLALASILLSILQIFLKFQEQKRTVVLLIHSAISIILSLLVFVKYKKLIDLKLKQLIRRKRENPYIHCIKSIWIQLLMLFIHPNIVCQGIVMHVSQPISQQHIPLDVNTILQIIMLGRIYLLYDSIVSSSLYCSTRASRMCRIYNTKDSNSFGPKSFFNTYPLHSLIILYVSLVIIFSRMLSLAESSNPNFLSFDDFVWCVIITMGTIGYGDYFPGSYLGRVIAFSAAISGIIWASLLILTLSQYLTMTSKESKSHITLKRLELRKLLEKYAEEAVAETSKLGNEGALKNVKIKSQSVKLTLRRLKNTVDSHSLNQEISNLFQTLYGNLMDIYVQQKTYAQALNVLHKQQKETIQQIRFTFADEIENIIKDK